MGGILIFCGLIALVIKLISSNSNDKIEKNITKKEKNDVQNLTYNKSKNYENQAISYYNKDTYSDYKKALDFFSKAILSSTERKHYLYYYRANTYLKLNSLNNALDDINTALKYLDKQDSENIIKYLYTKGLVLQKLDLGEDVIKFWKRLISFSKYKCNNCGKISNKKISYCTCGNSDFTVIDNEYINNAKLMLNDYEDKEKQDYVQKIHDIIFSKQQLVKQKFYNIFTAIYSKKKLEVAEENYELGLNEFYAENFDKAKEYFEQAVTLSPYNKEYRDCLKQISKEENKVLAEEIAILGIEQLNNGNANNAVKYFDEAIDMYECARYFFLRGKAFLLQGGITLYDKSVYNFNKAISLEPDNSEYYFYCGKAHFSRYKYNEALKCFTKAVNLKNDNWEYYYNKGLANYEIGNYADSIEDYSQCISLNYDILQNENILYSIKDSIDKVENISHNNENVIRLMSIIEQGNEYVEYANKGCNYVEKNDFKNAINYFNKSLEINPNYKFAYINRATTYTKLKEYQNAINDYSKVIDLDANWADAYRLGV